MKIDLHVHTNWGSSDSGLSPEELVMTAKEVGLDAICVTEHGTVWGESKLDEYSNDSDLLIIPGMEVATDLGHITVFGLEGYGSGIHIADTLRRAVDAVDGFMIAAHPFRRMFDDPRISGWEKQYDIDEASNLKIFSLVDEMEVVNGANNLKENLFALEVTDRLGWIGVGGSDSHSTTGFGAGGIVLDTKINNVREFITAMKDKAYYPVANLNRNNDVPFRELSDRK